MTERPHSKGQEIVGWILVLVVAGLALFFVPLMMSYFEYKLFGTQHVEDSFRWMGIHGTLSTVYGPIIDLLRLGD